MATLREMTGLSHNEIKAIVHYTDAVRKASYNEDEAIREIIGLSASPKIPRPDFSANQEKVLLIRLGMMLSTIVEKAKSTG